MTSNQHSEPNVVYANTDRELWREGDPESSMSYYEPSIHVTERGSIGINVGGTVYVKTLREWHGLVEQLETLRGSVDQALYIIEAWENDETPDVDENFDSDAAFIECVARLLRASNPAIKPEVSEGTPVSVGSRTPGQGDRTEAVPSETSDPASERVEAAVGDSPNAPSLTDQTRSETFSPASSPQMKDTGSPREVIGTSGTSENLIKTSDPASEPKEDR